MFVLSFFQPCVQFDFVKKEGRGALDAIFEDLRKYLENVLIVGGLPFGGMNVSLKTLQHYCASLR